MRQVAGCVLFLLALGGVAAIPAVAVALARRKPEDPLSCGRCGHSLAGLGGRGKCPKCGEGYEGATATRETGAGVARRRLLAVVIPITGLACVMPFAFALGGLGGAAFALPFNATLFGLVAVPLVILANRTSLRGMAALTIGGTLGALGLLVPAYWFAFAIPDPQDPQGGSVFVVIPALACAPAGVGLLIGFLIEGAMRTRAKA